MLRSCTQDVLEQVTPWSSSRGEALPRPPRDMANAQPVLRGYYTTWVDEIWNTTFKERRWGRGRRKPNKRDILLSAKNQEGKRKKKKPQPFVYLAWRAGCLGTGAWLSQGRSRLCCPTLGSGSRIWLALPWLPALPQAAASLQRRGKRHPHCLHKCVLTNVNSPS